jgi:glycosyltransferase involved in cell wall biosynthesis
MKIAIVHPWFLEIGGAEKVVDVLASMYPDADLFAISAEDSYLSPQVCGRNVHTSVIDKLVLLFRSKRAVFMPLYPWAVEGLNVSEYDLILSSCGPAVMGVSGGQNTVHISYMHSPQRAWWDFYGARQARLPWVTRQAYIFFASFMRMWEFNAMQRVDHVASNSNYIASRVLKYFRRQSTVIYPPVNTSMGYLADQHGDYYLSLSRLNKDKRIDLAILACNRLKRRLLVVGGGREERELKSIAGPTVEFLGEMPDAELPALYAKCRAFLFAADEDFGIAPVEAQAFGRPVIAYGHGGSLETVRVSDPEGRSDTGVFFPGQTVGSVVAGILRFEAQEDKFIPAQIQQHARQFDTSVFVKKMREFVGAAIRGR